MNRFYPLAVDRAGHRCEYCHAPELVFNVPFEVEHIIPIFLGSNDAESNLALACRSCNLRKGIRTTGIDPESKIEISLFNPRQDFWHQHFEVDDNSGQIIGKTSTGKLTISTLKMNSQTQIAARQIWIRLDLFP
jgi:hypothetical protein